jgi:hypothetical protein
MRHHNAETSVHLQRANLTPRDILIGLLEDEGDILGWEEELLIYEASMRLDTSPETSLRMARMALNGLLRDGVVVRQGPLICLKD